MYYQTSLARHGISVEVNKYIVKHKLYHIVPCIFCLLTTFDFSGKLGFTGIAVPLLYHCCAQFWIGLFMLPYPCFPVACHYITAINSPI